MLTPHETLYGRRLISTLCGGALCLRSLVGLDWVQETSRNVEVIQQFTRYSKSKEEQYICQKMRSSVRNE